MKREAVALCLIATLALPHPAMAQADHLEMLAAPQLLDCDPRPYFRTMVNVVDAERKPIGIALNTGGSQSPFQVWEGTLQHPVLWVGGTEGESAQRSYSILLFDTSGSMNARLAGQTRFTVAKAAVRRSLQGYVDGVDHMAVIPFDSRDVVARIRKADFQSTRVGVEAQLDALPPPTKGNTAIYSSVAEALPILKARADAGFPVSLVLFSDGANDVNHPGDDPGLLGDEGLAIVKALAAKMRVPLTTVGFGVSGNARAEGNLRDLAWPNRDNYYDAATNPERVTQILQIARRKLTDRVQLLFGPVRARRDQLAGQSIQFQVRYRTADGFVTSRLEPLWDAPGVGVPVADTSCATAEARAILASGPTGTDPSSLWKRVLILCMFGSMIAGLWFGAPRLMWPESYIPKPAYLHRPNVQLPPGVVMPPIDRPRMPNLQSSPPQRAAPAPRRAPERNDSTVVITPAPPRAARPQPPSAPRDANPSPRDAQEETLFRPPDRIPDKDR
jgi:hypothetical protein